MLGTIILWFGWYGFNAGSALTYYNSPNASKLLSLSAVNTTLSGGMAGLTALFVNLFWLERTLGEPIFDLVVAMNGALAGLVAITAGCGVGTCVDSEPRVLSPCVLHHGFHEGLVPWN
jgi:ammonium transporter, Amt family